MPSILVVLGFVLFFGNAGWANRLLMAISGARTGPLRILYKPEAIILAHGFYNFPLVLRLVGDGLLKARRAYAPAAATLGATPFQTSLTILFPIALPSLLAAALLVFLYSFTSFAVVLVLGGGPAATTLAVEIYRYARISLDFSSAGMLACIETAIAGLVFIGYLFFEGKSRTIIPDLVERPLETRGTLWGAAVIILYGLGMCFFVLGPLVSIPIESFLSRTSRASAPGISLRWWRSLGERSIPALFRSIFLALLSATLACMLASLAAAAATLSRTTAGAPAKPERSGTGSFLGTLLRAVATAPLVSSGIVLGLGWLILYGRDHARSIGAVAAVHAVTALPFAFNSISEGLKALPLNTMNAASVFGAGPVQRIVTVALPLSMRRLRAAWGFSAAISLGELNAIMILGIEDWETLPLLIYRAAGSYRYGTACAAGTLLILSCAGAFLLSEAGAGTRKKQCHGP
jgi:thiamine transport system permease protein